MERTIKKRYYAKAYLKGSQSKQTDQWIGKRPAAIKTAAACRIRIRAKRAHATRISKAPASIVGRFIDYNLHRTKTYQHL